MARRRRPPRAGALTELPPLKILTQICLLQCAYYLSATILILFTALVAGKKFSFDLILSWRSLRGDTTVGWMLGLVWMLNSFIGVIFLLILISRSKLIPDFALTLHLIHLLLTSIYTHSIPTNLLWWALQIASAAQMTFLGIWSCQWRELRPINFGGSPNSTNNNNSNTNNNNSFSINNINSNQGGSAGGMSGEHKNEGSGTREQIDEELGYGRGRKKSRLLGLQLARERGDEAGEYELVAMKEGGNG